MKQIKTIFQFNTNKIHDKYEEVPDDYFFEKYVNRINYQCDIHLLPTLRNDLVMKSKIGHFEHFTIPEKLDLIINQNVMDKNTSCYINNLKRRYQRDKDSLDLAYMNRLKDPVEFKILDTFRKIKDEMNERLYDQGHYEISSYFNNKYESYNKVNISDERAKKIVLSLKSKIDKAGSLIKKIFGKFMRDSLNNKMNTVENSLNNFMSQMSQNNDSYNKILK